MAGIVLVILPTVIFGGVSILSLLIGNDEYMENPLRQDLWRAGHAHAGVFRWKLTRTSDQGRSNSRNQRPQVAWAVPT